MSPMVKLPLTIEHALLGFLREQPMHAYEIHLTTFTHLALHPNGWIIRNCSSLAVV